MKTKTIATKGKRIEMERKDIISKSWDEFKSSGLLWFVNSIIQVFGWSIVYDRDINTKEIVNVFPAKVRFRGFGEKENSDGYKNITNHLKENISKLVEDVAWE